MFVITPLFPFYLLRRDLSLIMMLLLLLSEGQVPRLHLADEQPSPRLIPIVNGLSAAPSSWRSMEKKNPNCQEAEYRPP